MFEPKKNGRIFGVHPGVDFPKALVTGVLERSKDHPPEYLAKIELFVNTRRMQRKVQVLFEEGPARLLPRIRLITELSTDYFADLSSPPISPLRRRLELINLITALLDREPELAPRSTIFDLADSLALLLDEMHDEGVGAESIRNLDVTDQSGHWERSKKFLEIVHGFLNLNGQTDLDISARQRSVITELTNVWAHSPLNHPVIIAGSTGSRGSTSLLMNAVAHLPNGALVLPGFDFDLPQSVWKFLDDPKTAEGHPQFRLRNIVTAAGCQNSEVQPWHISTEPAAPERNRLVSLALRPAPVTDQWMKEGPLLTGVNEATNGMALIEAPSNRAEAMAIALILRHAAEGDQTAALVTPDKILARRVRAAMDRWRIEPDISAGESLETTAQGRLYRHVVDMFGQPLNSESLLVLLKHPLVCPVETSRFQHLTWTRELELELRKRGGAFPSATDLNAWVEKSKGSPEKHRWIEWVSATVFPLCDVGNRALADHLEQHTSTVERLMAGLLGSETTDDSSSAADKEMARVLLDLKTEAHRAKKMSPWDYGNLFLGILKRNEVRDPVRPHPKIMIWGTLESRVQGADLVILGGLNEGTWPKAPAADPWLNREMRLKAGLLLPDRQIGLSAHDFQQAVSAKNVVLSRSVRNDDAPNVPSRWLSRLTNLLGGISNDGSESLQKMRARGQVWLDLVQDVESPDPVTPEPRPAPSPPVDARPNSLSVTAITKLIRDPYAIYARNVLQLRPLNSLHPEPDARLRGILLHRIMEHFIRNSQPSATTDEMLSHLLDTAEKALESGVPWPTTKILWASRLRRIAKDLIADEQVRRARGTPTLLEQRGKSHFADIDFTLTADADRVDVTPDGQLIVYDYKTGKIPTKPEMDSFEKQLPLEALLLESGGFEDIKPAAQVVEAAHIGLGSDASFKRYFFEQGDTQKTRAELVALVSGFKLLSQGYASRRAMAKLRYSGDYDHLARFGEWDESQSPTLIEVGK